MLGRAWLVVVLVSACGGGHAPFPNGSPDALPPDTLPPMTADAMPTSVTIAVTLNGMPVSNVPAYFQAADSTLAGAATTDAQGTAGAILATGGFVTVIEPEGG